MLVITSVTIVLADHYIFDGTMLVEDGKIIDFGRKLNIPKGQRLLTERVHMQVRDL